MTSNEPQQRFGQQPHRPRCAKDSERGRSRERCLSVDEPPLAKRPAAKRSQENAGKDAGVLESDDRSAPVIRRAPLNQGVQRDEDQCARDAEDHHQCQRGRQTGSEKAKCQEHDRHAGRAQGNQAILDACPGRDVRPASCSDADADRQHMSGSPDMRNPRRPARPWHRPGCSGQRDSRSSRRRLRRIWLTATCGHARAPTRPPAMYSQVRLRFSPAARVEWSRPH